MSTLNVSLTTSVRIGFSPSLFHLLNCSFQLYLLSSPITMQTSRIPISLGKRKRCQVLTTNVEMARGRGATPQSAPFTPDSSLLYCASLQQRRETQSPESEKSTGSTSEIPEDGIMVRTVPLSSLIPTLLPTLQYETGTRGHTAGQRGLSSLQATTELILRSG